MTLLHHRKINEISILVLIFLLGACDRTDYSVHTLGQPTPLNGQTPVEILCSIQREFHELPKPILSDIKYHKEDSRLKQVEFHFTHERLPEYYQYKLTDTALEWTKKHSQAEITAALLPLILDPSIGGEAAVLITSLASNRTFRSKEYGRHTSQISSDISKLMFETKYRSPSNRGSWGIESALSFVVPNEVWLTYSFPLKKNNNSDAQNIDTLNNRLSRLRFDLRYYENGLMLRYDRDFFKQADTLDEWMKKNPLPPIPEQDKHQALLDNYGKAFVILGGYSGGLPYGIAVYELGLHRYWPVVYSQSHTIKELSWRLKNRPDYLGDYFRELKQRVYEYSQETCKVNF